MKKILIAVAAMVATVGLWAQGSVNFSNYPAAVRQAFYDADGTSLLGPTFYAQLYVGDTAGSLSAVGLPTAFKTTSGAPNGFFLGGAVALTQNWGATIFYQAKVYSTSQTSYEAASVIPNQHVGATTVLSMQLPSKGVSDPPPTAPNMVFEKLVLTIVPVPEPSAIALGVLGGLGLFLLRRRS